MEPNFLTRFRRLQLALEKNLTLGKKLWAVLVTVVDKI